jgi:hypothetical protein
MTAKEWLFKTHPQVIPQWGLTGFDDEYMVRMMDEFLASEIERRIAERMPTDVEKAKCVSCKIDFPIMETYFNWDTGARRCWTCQVAYLENIIKQIDKRMPTEKDAIRYAADYATELDASEEPHTDIEKMDIFLHGTRWFRSRMTEKEEPYIDKSISIDEYMNMNPKLDPHEQSEEDASDDDIEEEEWHEIHDDINEERRSGGIE